MKCIFSLLIFFFSWNSFSQIQHCGYDFTSYLVVDVYENGKTENVKELKISIVDENGNEVVNVNNLYSWNKANLPMVFTQNYLVSNEGEKERYFFPYAKDQYFISVTNTFPAEQFSIKIEDPNGIYKSQMLPLQSYNLYILCSAENERQARSFGPRSNRPIEVVLEKK
ncbi:hypothetical protein NHF50_12995 [Flavobacterium sp. NRK F10]|uniref:hypothetical protein n=1 Tax=Flavobacterium sp. NRK F10 TaxID=2954931 RepID=UPI002091A597|nr:hypothetical protein [Flavobacterium sp. NRK F10]MCO6175962.1 hypothetical protein [Flavobacterium sp. NRK F10]